MIRHLLLGSTVFAMLAAAPSASQANDIVDFLNAMRGSSRHHVDHRPVVVEPDRYRSRHHDDHRDHDFHNVSSRNDYRRYADRSRYGSTYHRSDYGRSDYHRPDYSSRSRTRVSLQIGNQYPVVSPQVSPSPIYLSQPQHAPLIHDIGQFVTCPVHLEPHVIVHDADEIAPHAIPAVIAVRNPHLGAYGSHGCVESLVYVEVCVPPCPLERMTVSPCRTKIKLDYGHHEIEITSCDGHVDVEYDD